MNAKSIKIDNNRLNITWNNGTNSSIGLEYLREQCPCANCKGEKILLQPMRPVKRISSNTEMYKVIDIKPVGGYAIKISWADGHDTGVYNWEYLIDLSNGEKSGKEFEYKPLI